MLNTLSPKGCPNCGGRPGFGSGCFDPKVGPRCFECRSVANERHEVAKALRLAGLLKIEMWDALKEQELRFTEEQDATHASA